MADDEKGGLPQKSLLAEGNKAKEVYLNPRSPRGKAKEVHLNPSSRQEKTEEDYDKKIIVAAKFTVKVIEIAVTHYIVDVLFK